jgi:hypothetical protein
MAVSLTENTCAKPDVSSKEGAGAAMVADDSETKKKRYVLRSKNPQNRNAVKVEAKVEREHSDMDIADDEPLSADALHLCKILRYGFASLQQSARHRWRANRRLLDAKGGSESGAVKVFQKPAENNKVLDPNEGAVLSFINHIKLRLTRYFVQSTIDELKQSLALSNTPLTSHWLTSGDSWFGSKVNVLLRAPHAFINIHIDGAHIAVTCDSKSAANPSSGVRRLIFDAVDVKALKAIMTTALMN